MNRIVYIAMIFAAGIFAWAGEVQDEAAQLVQDAKEILAAHRVSPVAPAKYAQCIFNLEKAQRMLEGAGDTTSVVAQEVNATLFWAKRFSTLEISNELGKLRSGAPPMALPRTQKPPPVVTPPKAPAVAAAPAQKSLLPEADKLNAAKAAYHQAEQFAQKKKNDPFAVALRWFQVASTYSGNEYALKALEKAQEAHARSAASGKAISGDTAATGTRGPSKRALIEAEELKSQTPEIEAMRQAEALAEEHKYPEAIEKYKASIKIKDTISVESRMGYTYFKLAQTSQEQLLPKYKEVEDEYSRAWIGAYRSVGAYKVFDDRSPALVAAQRKIDALRKEADSIVINYTAAQTCFERILKLVPDGKDFYATAYAGISMAKRKEAQVRARIYLADFLKEFKPGDIGEQITYEYCKSELDRIK